MVNHLSISEFVSQPVCLSVCCASVSRLFTQVKMIDKFIQYAKWSTDVMHIVNTVSTYVHIPMHELTNIVMPGSFSQQLWIMNSLGSR